MFQKGIKARTQFLEIHEKLIILTIGGPRNLELVLEKFLLMPSAILKSLRGVKTKYDFVEEKLN